MSVGFSLYLFFHIIASIALVIGYLHEDKVVEFEDILVRAIRKKLRSKKVQKSKKATNCNNQQYNSVEKNINEQKETYIFSTSLDKYDCFHAA